MKKMILGAGAFLLGSSALVGAAQANSHSAAWTMNPMLQHAALDAGVAHAKSVQTDWVGDQAMGKPVAADKAVSALYSEFDGAMSYQEAAAWTGDKSTEVAAVHVAEKDAWLAQHGTMTADAGKSADAEFANAQTGSDVGGTSNMSGKADAGAASDMGGQGGPDELASSSGQTDLPACRPGPGDDRCIQLYERGMSAAYAQWSAGRAQLGMGGPEEPVSGKDQLASADMAGTSDMAAPVKAESQAGPTTEPTGARVAGKGATADAGAVFEHGTADMSAPVETADASAETMTHDGLTAEQMQTNSAWGAQANGA